MEFDKSRVYTAVNADKLKVGSEVIVANSPASLKLIVEENGERATNQLERINNESYGQRFHVGNRDWNLAYLVAPLKEPQYKPFSDSETAIKVITTHGGWVKDCDTYYLVTGINLIKGAVEIRIRDYWISAQYFLENFVFADDGTPVGEKIEDAAQNGGIV